MTDHESTREWGNRAFTEREKRAMRKLAEALFDDGHGDDPRDRIEWAISEADLLVGSTGPVTRIALHAGLLALQVLPGPFGFGWRRMSALAHEDRVRFLAALEHATVPGVSLPLFAWKTLLTVVYFEHPDALRSTGYDGACLTGEGSLLTNSRRASRAPAVPTDVSGRAA